VEIERATGRSGGGQNVLQGGAMIALPAKQRGRGGERFSLRIDPFSHGQSYRMPISMSTYIIYRSIDIFKIREGVPGFIGDIRTRFGEEARGGKNR
jgi:hypothetical protein